MFSFNPDKRVFELKSINPNHSRTDDVFAKVVAFYQRQSPDLANAGDIEMRSLWNEVTSNRDGIVYDPEDKSLNKNEMTPGFRNVLMMV